jgi:hypothetical protein
MSDISIDHLFIKELNRKNVLFPASRESIIEKLKDSFFYLSPDNKVSALYYLEKVKPEHFENGSAFWCAFHSACYQDIKRKFISEKQGRIIQ